MKALRLQGRCTYQLCKPDRDFKWVVVQLAHDNPVVFQSRMGNSVRIDTAAWGEVDLEVLPVRGRDGEDLAMLAFCISGMGMANMRGLSFRCVLQRRRRAARAW